MMLQPSLHRLQVLVQLEEDDVELDLGLTQLEEEESPKKILGQTMDS